MIRTITYRVVGREFSGRCDRLDAFNRAVGYALGYMDTMCCVDGAVPPKSVKLFQVGSGIMPCHVNTVHADGRVESAWTENPKQMPSPPAWVPQGDPEAYLGET